MAATYSICAPGVTFASGKSMLAIFNGVGSGVVLRVYRAWMLNNQTTGVTGVITTMALRRTSAQSGGTAVNATKHDTTSANLPAQVLIAQGATATDTADPDFMRWMWSNDEPAASTLTNDETECIVPLACVWDSTGDSDIEPIVLREGQGITVQNITSSTVGTFGLSVTFGVTPTYTAD
jgi:hypothetical protein